VAKLSLLLCYYGENNLPSTLFKICTKFNKNGVCNSETAAHNFCNACNETLVLWHGCPQGGNGHLTPSGNRDWERKFSRKAAVSSSIPINWFNSCNVSLCTSMTLTLHASQVHCFGVMHWWACRSLLSAHMQRQVVKLSSGLFYCRSLLRNNNMATSLQRFTSSSGVQRSGDARGDLRDWMPPTKA